MKNTKSLKTYDYKGHQVRLVNSVYNINNTLAAYMIEENDEIFGVVTVNLCDWHQDESHAFVDTNNLPGIDNWLESNGLAEKTDIVAFSGFCTYRLMKFNITAFN